MTDGALMRQVADRQPAALDALYDRHAPTLLALGRRILGNLPDAEEVLQEVFLHVWNHSGRYDPGRSSVSTWLVLIARSRAIDRLRTRKVVERTHESSAQANPVGHASPEGVETVFIHERRERVRSELAKLPDEQRQVLEMA
ncbi:MAG TPA: sigma-70 family RNA polymerase sigma factor, partial [Acidimicrobiales bacterium]|nr:sigma-70 family RNA polymerase sigma factor [Acidimicrobiales bacterium]